LRKTQATEARETVVLMLKLLLKMTPKSLLPTVEGTPGEETPGAKETLGSVVLVTPPATGNSPSPGPSLDEYLQSLLLKWGLSDALPTGRQRVIMINDIESKH
jgi:hypothetical protein